MKPSGGVDPAGDITTSANLGDVHTPDPARAGHEALGCFRYPHEGDCKPDRKSQPPSWPTEIIRPLSATEIVHLAMMRLKHQERVANGHSGAHYGRCGEGLHHHHDDRCVQPLDVELALAYRYIDHLRSQIPGA